MTWILQLLASIAALTGSADHGNQDAQGVQCMARRTTGNYGGDFVLAIAVPQRNADEFRARGYASVPCARSPNALRGEHRAICNAANTRNEAIAADFERIYGVQPELLCSRFSSQ